MLPIRPCRKKVKVITGSSFEQTMMGRSPRCYISSVVDLGPLVPEKKIFEGFFTIYIYGRGGHLGHVTQMSRAFVPPIQEAPHKIWH